MIAALESPTAEGPLVSPKEIRRGSDALTRGIFRWLNGRSNARKFHKEILGEEVDPGYCFADFMANVYLAKKEKSSDASKRLHSTYQRKSAMSETQGTLGGYLVPEDFSQELMQDISDESFFWPLAHVEEMRSLNKQLPVSDATTVPSANGVAPFWGGLQVKFATENTALSESEPKFRKLELNAWTLAAYALCSNQMLQDGGSGLEKWLRILFARSIAWYDDWYFLQGNGVGQPLGIINAGASVLVTRQTTGAHFTAQDSQTMVGSVYNLSQPYWLMSRTVLPQLTNITGWFPNGPLVLQGADIVPTMKQPALGTKGDVILLDPTLYVIGKRDDIEIDLTFDEPTAGLKWQNVWRFVQRIDGQPLLNNAITIPDGVGTNTVGSSVVLV